MNERWAVKKWAEVDSRAPISRICHGETDALRAAASPHLFEIWGAGREKPRRIIRVALVSFKVSAGRVIGHLGIGLEEVVAAHAVKLVVQSVRRGMVIVGIRLLISDSDLGALEDLSMWK